MRSLTQRIFAVILAIALVLAMPLTAFAASKQTDITYLGETFTVYISCTSSRAAANILTTCTTLPVSVECAAYTERGVVMRTYDICQTCEARVSSDAENGEVYTMASAKYYADAYLSGYVIHSWSVNAN